MTSPSIEPLTSIEEIFELFERFGNEHYGEGVTQSLHMRQCAYLAEQEGADSALVVAALLHDIGHFVAYADSCDISQDFRHERIGAEMLKHLFKKEVWKPIAYHVTAKRYLCAVDNKYAATLSTASKQSLDLQGGPLRESQAKAFEQNPFFDSAIKLRHYDDHGKKIGGCAPALEYFTPYLNALEFQ